MLRPTETAAREVPPLLLLLLKPPLLRRQRSERVAQFRHLSHKNILGPGDRHYGFEPRDLFQCADHPFERLQGQLGVVPSD